MRMCESTLNIYYSDFVSFIILKNVLHEIMELKHSSKLAMKIIFCLKQ